MSPISGGDSGGVPPLPIPNREVKPACADGTAMQCGRVGNRLFSSRQWMESSGREILRRTFFVSRHAGNITVVYTDASISWWITVVSSLVLEFLPFPVFMVWSFRWFPVIDVCNISLIVQSLRSFLMLLAGMICLKVNLGHFLSHVSRLCWMICLFPLI